MRRKAVDNSVTLMTALDTVRALLGCLESKRNLSDIPLVDITKI